MKTKIVSLFLKREHLILLSKMLQLSENVTESDNQLLKLDIQNQQSENKILKTERWPQLDLDYFQNNFLQIANLSFSYFKLHFPANSAIHIKDHIKFIQILKQINFGGVTIEDVFKQQRSRLQIEVLSSQIYHLSKILNRLILLNRKIQRLYNRNEQIIFISQLLKSNFNKCYIYYITQNKQNIIIQSTISKITKSIKTVDEPIMPKIMNYKIDLEQIQTIQDKYFYPKNSDFLNPYLILNLKMPLPKSTARPLNKELYQSISSLEDVPSFQFMNSTIIQPILNYDMLKNSFEYRMNKLMQRNQQIQYTIKSYQQSIKNYDNIDNDIQDSSLKEIKKLFCSSIKQINEKKIKDIDTEQNKKITIDGQVSKQSSPHQTEILKENDSLLYKHIQEDEQSYRLFQQFYNLRFIIKQFIQFLETTTIIIKQYYQQQSFKQIMHVKINRRDQKFQCALLQQEVATCTNRNEISQEQLPNLYTESPKLRSLRLTPYDFMETTYQQTLSQKILPLDHQHQQTQSPLRAVQKYKSSYKSLDLQQSLILSPSIAQLKIINFFILLEQRYNQSLNQQVKMLKYIKLYLVNGQNQNELIKLNNYK